MFINNEFDWDLIRRVIRVVVYFNRLLKEGKDEEFQLFHIKDGNLVKGTQKKFAEIGIQVVEDDIIEEMEMKKDVVEDMPEADDSAMGRICSILKYHLICLQTRIDISRRKYLFKVWDDLTLEEILKNKLLNVHFDLKGKKQKYHLNFEEYLREVFAFIMKGIMSIDVVEER